MASALHVVCESRKPLVTRSPRDSSPHLFRHPILRLQQTAGNRAVAQLHGGGHLQAKLTVGAPDDAYEQEADRVAARVLGQMQPGGRASAPAGMPVQRQPVEEEEELLQPRRNEALPAIQRQEEEELLWARGSQPVPVIQRQEDDELLWMRGAQPIPAVQRQVEEEEEELLQPRSQASIPVVKKPLPKAQQASNPGPAPSPASRQGSGMGVDPSSPVAGGDIESQIAAGRGGGQSLDRELRSELEGAFGYDFGGVRVHTGTVPDTLAVELRAEAFTSDQDIFFRAGRYQPGTEAGRFLIAHELTHVVQQGAAESLERGGEG